jgi:hypothetical protein
VLLRLITLAALVVCTTQFPNVAVVGLKVWACAIGADRVSITSGSMHRLLKIVVSLATRHPTLFCDQAQNQFCKCKGPDC